MTAYEHRSIVATLTTLNGVLNRWSDAGWEIFQVAVVSQTDIIVIIRRPL